MFDSANGRKMSMSCRLWNADWSKRSLEAARQVNLVKRHFKQTGTLDARTAELQRAIPVSSFFLV